MHKKESGPSVKQSTLTQIFNLAKILWKENHLTKKILSDTQFKMFNLSMERKIGQKVEKISLRRYTLDFPNISWNLSMVLHLSKKQPNLPVWRQWMYQSSCIYPIITTFCQILSIYPISCIFARKRELGW